MLQTLPVVADQPCKKGPSASLSPQGEVTRKLKLPIAAKPRQPNYDLDSCFSKKNLSGL
jgi:hypothetical protein